MPSPVSDNVLEKIHRAWLYIPPHGAYIEALLFAAATVQNILNVVFGGGRGRVAGFDFFKTNTYSVQ